ncbi:MAG TPA: hypothetical protein PLF40_01115 [Kofleriaceae bacterium]|nr:hypothetical protein [Kofleriaceae bacterium]
MVSLVSGSPRERELLAKRVKLRRYFKQQAAPYKLYGLDVWASCLHHMDPHQN